MANKTIPQLPEQTGKTDDDLLVIVDSGETTTSKIKVSTLLSGVGGSPGVIGDTLTDSISSVNSIVGTPNVYEGTSGYVNFGYGNDVNDDTITHGYNNTSGVGTTPSGNICIGYNNNYQSQYVGNEAGQLVIGKDNTKRNDGIFIGSSNFGSRGIYVGRSNTQNNNNDISAGMLFGASNTTNGTRALMVGRSNINGNDFGIALGFENNQNSRNWALSVGYANNINSVGNSTNGYNTCIGTNNTITAGIGNFNVSNDSDMGSTGTNNSIFGGFQQQYIGASGNNNTILGGTGSAFLNTTNNSTIIGGTTNIISDTNNSVIVGGTGNTLQTYNNCVILGGTGLTTSFNDEVVCEHLTIKGQSTYNWSNNGSGSVFILDLDEGNLQEISMSADTIIDLTNVKVGGRYSIKVFNEASYLLLAMTATGFSVLWEGGSIPLFTSGGTDLLVLEVFGSDILVRYFANFATAE